MKREGTGRWDLTLPDLVDLVRGHIWHIVLVSTVSAAVVGLGSFAVVHERHIATTTLAITSPTGSRAQTNRLIQDVFVLFEDEDTQERVKEEAGLPQGERYAISYEQGVDSRVVELKVSGPSAEHALMFSETLLDVVADLLQGSMERESLATLNEPEKSVVAEVPPHGVYALEAAIGGFLLSTLGIALWSKVDVRIKAEDIERELGVALLGRVPLGVQGAETGLLEESYRALAANIRFASLGCGGKVLVLAPTRAATIGQQMARGLAEGLSAAGGDVLLIDADMHTQDEAEGQAGLSEVLAGDIELARVVVHGDGDGFEFLPAGHHAPNPSDLFASRAFGKFVGRVRAAYDFTILCAPDASAFVDAVVMACPTDGVLLAMRDRSLLPAQVRRDLEQFKRAGARILGAAAVSKPQREGAAYCEGYEGHKAGGAA